MQQIKGQPILFNESGCEDYCLYVNTGSTTFETDFCIQEPLEDSGTNLISSSIDLDNDNEVHSGTLTYSASGTCQAIHTEVFDSLHNQVTAGEDGYYFFKWTIDSATITYGEDQDGISGNLELHYSYDGNDAYTSFNEDTLSGGFKSQTEWTLTTPGTNSILADIDGYYEGSGTCYQNYELENLTTDMVKMWAEETFTATNNTFYLLQFKNTNATGVTVKVYNSAGTLIYQSASDSVGFDKVFKTGTLPTDKTVTVRFEIDDFVSYAEETFYEDVLTDVYLAEACKYVVWIETDAGTYVDLLTEEHFTITEPTGLTYHRNVKYCLDTTSLGVNCYRLRAISDCDASEYVSNKLCVCDGDCEKLSHIAWDHNSVVNSGDYVIDTYNYDYTSYVWVRCSLQDVTYEEEREQYVTGKGTMNTTWTLQRETEILQIWTIPPFLRRALALGLSNDFTINGVGYQKLDDDAFSPQFSARYNSAMRITVAQVGNYQINRP